GKIQGPSNTDCCFVGRGVFGVHSICRTRGCYGKKIVFDFLLSIACRSTLGSAVSVYGLSFNEIPLSAMRQELPCTLFREGPLDYRPSFLRQRVRVLRSARVC